MQIIKVFGPPGTGKTTRMLQVMEQELALGIKPDRLAYLSFTVQARREALERAMAKFNLLKEDLPNFKTLHAICYRELNMTAGGMVKGQEELKQFGDRFGVNFTYKLKHADDMMLELPYGGEVGDRLLRLDHVRRHRMISVEDTLKGQFEDDITDFHFRHFVTEYTRWKTNEGLRDFTDLLEQATEPLDVDVVIVDEAQDLSRLQWATLHRIICGCQRLYLAGDDDQAIFTWAGADPGAFIEHPGEVVVLDQSYRIPAAVHQLAADLSARIRSRQQKQWRPRHVDGVVKRQSPEVDLSFNGAGSVLVLYRHHYLVGQIEDAVRLRGLPYSRGDRAAPGAEWGPAIIFWERLRKGGELTWREANKVVDAMAVGPSLSSASARSFASLPRDTKFTLPSLLAALSMSTPAGERPWFEALTKIASSDQAYLRALIRSSGREGLTTPPAIRLSTIHAAKGAEADHVILLTEVSRRVRETIELSPDEERRVFYVGVTRAKETLTIVGDDNPLL